MKILVFFVKNEEKEKKTKFKLVVKIPLSQI